MKPSATRTDLDAKIVEIELTLVSIIQGVALTFLVEGARHVASIHEIVFWPYVLSGLLIIFVFWSRSVLHIMTVIRWPLEFGHNFLYIACALLEGLLFARVAEPMNWFVFGAVFIALGWILFVYDLRLISARARDSVGPASQRLSAQVTRDQKLNIMLLLPGVFLLNVACAAAIHFWPELFIAQSRHVGLAAIQIVGFLGYLFYVVRFFSKLAPLIAEARAEWRERE